MPAKKKTAKPDQDLRQQNEILLARNQELEIRLQEAEETLRAIHEGEVDAVVVSGDKGEQIFSLMGADSIYRLIVETMKEAAFTVTFDGTILFCNAQFGEFVKRGMEQVVGHPLEEFLAPDSRTEACRLLAVAREEPAKQRLVFQATDGAEVPAHVSANVLNQPDALSICVVATDLTELENSTELIQKLRRQQEELQAANEELATTEEELRVQNDELIASQAELGQARARYLDLFETAPDGYIVTDSQGMIQEANEAAAQLLGRPADALKGCPFSALLAAAGREGYLRLLAALEAATAPLPMWEVEIPPKQGPPFWAAVTAAASCDKEGKIVGLRWLVRDITERKRAEVALAAAHRQVQGIIDNTPAIVYAFDLAERFLLANAAVAELLNTTPEQMIGKRRHEFMPKADADWHEANDRKVIEAGRALEFDEASQLPGRSIAWFTTKFPLRDAQGRIYAVAGISTDVSARKRAEEALRASEERFRALTMATSDVVYRMSPQWSEMRQLRGQGFTPDTEHPGKDWLAKYIHPDDQSHVAAAISEAIRTKSVFELEHRVFRVDGTLGWTLSRAIPLLDAQGEIVEWFGAASDVTERKRAQAELQDANDGLAATAKELARSNEDLQQFAYVVSHDLQEPLRTVAGFLKLLEERYRGQLDAKAQEYIAFSVDGAGRMSAMIADLLEFSRVTSKGQAPAPVDLAAVAGYALANLRAAIQESDAVIAVDPLPTVLADEGQMGQLFQNLIGNALKFRAEGRRPEVHVGARREGGEWVFHVKDNGIGIDPKQADRLFKLFQRLHSRADYPGTGIGLAICRKIVERHGGRIWVESQVGQGSMFCFTIPSGGQTVAR